jgi:ketosteroid isomerase-like protein
MSQENIEIVRRVYDAHNQRDWDAAFRDAHPEFEMTFQRGPNAGTHRGRERVQAMLLDQRAAFDSWIAEPLEMHESGEQVVVIIRNRLRPKGSGAEFEFRNGHIWTIRDGTILSLVGFPSPEEALEALGCGSRALTRRSGVGVVVERLGELVLGPLEVERRDVRFADGMTVAMDTVPPRPVPFAGYCVGDVEGERRAGAGGTQRVCRVG